MRKMLAVWTAVAALGAGQLFDGPAAEAAPSASPFAGKYTGPVPDASSAGDWGSISVSSGGGIVFTQPPAEAGAWKYSGSVHADGTFSIIGTVTFRNRGFTDFHAAPAESSNSAERSREGVAEKPGIETTLTIESTGTMARGGDGSLYGTTTRGDSFVWTPK